MYGVTLELKDSGSNVTSFYGVWLDSTRQSYDLYRDSTLTDSFRIVMQDVCDHVEPSTVIGKYYDFNYTDDISKQNILNDTCEVKYDSYGVDRFIARCCTKYMPTSESLGGEYYGEITSFDILINSDHNWTTGNFSDYKVYDREHSMRHEVTHGIGIHHNDHSPLMKSDEDYNVYNPQRYITDNDRYNYHAIYNPPEFIKPQESVTGYSEFLLDDNTKVNLSALKPSVLQTDSADIDFYLLNEDYTWDFSNVNDIVIAWYHSFNPDSSKYIYQWEPDPLLITNKPYKILAIYSGFTANPTDMAVYPRDELKIRFSNLTLKSPEYNKEYSIYAPLDFEVFGKSENADVHIMNIYNIGTVEYVLEKEELLGNEFIFSETTTLADSLKFKKELSDIQDLETGDYLVSVTARDLQGAVIAEISDFPIRINTRSIQIELPTTEEFMIYDFHNTQNPYLQGKFYYEDSLNNNAFTIPSYENVELYDVEWCENYGSYEGVFAGIYPSSLFITDDSYVWDTYKWPGSKTIKKSEILNYSEIRNTLTKDDNVDNATKDFIGKTWYIDQSGNPLKLRPGLYRFCGNVYDKSFYPDELVKMAETDTLMMLIPSWKMKTEPDLRFGKKDRVHFRKGDDIEICIWRPVNGLKANDTQVNLYSENKAQLLSSETVSYTDSLGVTTMVNFPTTNLDYGFYTIEAKEIDYTTGREVTYQNEIQVCPLYVRWENSGSWPTDWPGTDDLYWRLSLFANTDPLIKSYAMKNNYDYDTDLYPLMNTQMNSPSVTLNKPYNAFMQIYIGLWRLNNIFKELLAEYSVSISVNNMVTWDIIKTATAAEWATYSWPTELNRWCFTNTETAIEYTNQPIYIKLSGIDTEGIPRDTIFTEGVMHDEIMIAYTKEDLLESPENLAAQFYEAGKYSAVQLSWDQSPDFQTGRFYRIYRDGVVIADQLTTLSYLDYSTVPNRMYNYIVTLVDSYLEEYLSSPVCESPKAGNSINFYTGLLSPSNLVITEESPDVRLNWSPVSGATGYKVYSSGDPYGTFSENTTGAFNEEEWIAPLTESKLFYYVVAVNENKKVIKILRSSGNQVK